MLGINKVILLGVISFPEILESEQVDNHLRFNVGIIQPTRDGGETIIVVPCLASGRLAMVLRNYAVSDATSVYLEGWLRPDGPALIVSVDTVQILKAGFDPVLWRLS